MPKDYYYNFSIVSAHPRIERGIVLECTHIMVENEKAYMSFQSKAKLKAKDISIINGMKALQRAQINDCSAFQTIGDPRVSYEDLGRRFANVKTLHVSFKMDIANKDIRVENALQADQWLDLISPIVELCKKIFPNADNESSLHYQTIEGVRRACAKQLFEEGWTRTSILLHD